MTRDRRPASFPGPGDLWREPREPMPTAEEIEEMRAEGQWSPCWECSGAESCNRSRAQVRRCTEVM